MKSNLKIGMALTVFLGLILYTEWRRSFNDEITTGYTSEETLADLETEVPSYEKPTDTAQILQIFFPEGELKGKNLIRWKPDLERRMQMHVADDGYCYTSLDTILEGQNSDEQKIYIFLTNKYDSEMHIDGCHPCAPNYSVGIAQLNDDSLKVINFSKYLTTAGAWGEGGEIELLSMVGNKNILKITSSWTGMGQHTIYENLFDLDQMIHLLGYQSYHEDEMALYNQFYAAENASQTQTELKTELNPHGKYDLILATKETRFDTVQEKVITRYTSKVYRWNEHEELELCYE